MQIIYYSEYYNCAHYRKIDECPLFGLNTIYCSVAMTDETDPLLEMR